MPVAIRYIGAEERFFEVAITGQQQGWLRGQTSTVSDENARLLFGTGLFELSDARPAHVPVFMPSAATSDAINAAGALAQASGGGDVYIPPTGITMTGPIQLRNGVEFKGSFPKYAYNGIADAESLTFVTGSILIGNGTFRAFEYNASDLGAPLASSDDFSDAALTNAGVSGVAIQNCLDGIKVGALYNPGAFWCRFEDIAVKASTGWGVWFENFFHSQFKNINTFGNITGGQAYVGSGTNKLNSGNSLAEDIFSITPAAGNNSRGIVVWSRGNSISGLNIDKAQSNRSGTQVVQAATMANGSANITVIDGSKFPVGMTVTPDATANGFTQKQMYFVLTLVGNVLTLGNKTFGAAISATGNAAVNLTSRGYPAFEAAGLGASDSVGIDVRACDFEGQATTLVLYQNTMSQSGTSDFAGLIETEQSDCELTIRNCGSGYAIMHFGRVDQDTGSRFLFGGTISGFVNAKPVGAYRNTNIARNVLNLAQNWPASFTHDPGPSFMNKTSAGADFTYPGVPIGKHAATLGNAVLSIGTGYGNAMLFCGSANGVWTLPVIDANGVGMVYDITNGSPNDSTLTVNASGVVFNNKVGKSSYLLAQGQFLQVVAQNNGSGAFTWQVMSTNAT